MGLRISQTPSNFPKYDRNKSFLEFYLDYIHLILEGEKIIRDKFLNNIFYIESFGNSVAESK